MNIVQAEIEQYAKLFSSPEDPVLNALSRETHLKAQMPQMLSGHLQGLFLEQFSKLLKPSRILEIGTFTGYSAICLAKGLIPNGIVETIDNNEELRSMAEKYTELAGLQKSIIFYSGDAKKILKDLNGPYDLIFIDADKASYSTYYDLTFDKLRSGGYMIADNVLWSGKVIDENPDKDTQHLIEFNRKLKEDPRIENMILTLRDGLNIARKRP